MHIVDSFEVERWFADLSSAGLGSADCLRVVDGDLVLTNAFDAIDWSERPTQVMLCEACMIPGCAVGGRIQASTLGEHVLWTAPSERAEQDFNVGPKEITTPGLWASGSFAFTERAWRAWQERGAPSRHQLPHVTRGELESAWRMACPLKSRAASRDALSALLREAWLSTEPHNTTGVPEALARLQAWFREHPGSLADGSLQHPQTIDAKVVTLTFDHGSTVRDWHAFAIHEEAILPAFGADLVLAPT